MTSAIKNQGSGADTQSGNARLQDTDKNKTKKLSKRKSIKDLKISIKILVGFLFVLSIVVVNSGFSYQSITKLGSGLDVLTLNLEFANVEKEIDRNLLALRGRFREFALVGQEAQATESMKARDNLLALMKQTEALPENERKTQLKSAFVDINRYIEGVNALIEVRRKQTKIGQTVIDPKFKSINKLLDTMQTNAHYKNMSAAELEIIRCIQDLAQLRIAINKLLDFHDETFRASAATVQVDLFADFDRLEIVLSGSELAKDFDPMKAVWDELTTGIEDANKVSKVLHSRMEGDLKTLSEKINATAAESVAKAQATERELSAQVQVLSTSAKRRTLIFMAGGLVFGILLSFLIGRNISSAVTRIASAMERLAQGDRSVNIPDVERGDEVGEMARALEVFKDNLHETERLRQQQEEQKREAEVQRKQQLLALADSFEDAVGGIAQVVGKASNALKIAAQDMADTSKETSEESSSVAIMAESSSSSVHSIAAATEELTFSIRTIRDQVQRSRDITEAAATEAKNTNTKMQELSHATDKIGSIVAMISSITEQTNMLALNATIEAARAGAAGRGFAVVAQEVKALAAQTAKATSDIEEQMSNIQTSTNNAAGFIASIARTTEEASTIASNIDTGVSEQSFATQEIARNIHKASENADGVATSVENLAKVSSATGSTAQQVLSAAADLSSQSDHLQHQLEDFLKTIRAA